MRAEVKQTLELAGGGRAHVIAMPVDQIDTARCLVAIGPNGDVAVSCTDPRVDLTPDD